ncbi:hypothetical protein ARMGADRAFT_1026185 [Armillaria gallica]|uniref:Uncharacterized protein n=1 Tax=Armillaria gallica TaxID=47427 RepID=A0A2H3E4H9_ARMGA|nr:hypothetical protein ARMGADRAFT_1026185 [Armillaria gallica]
MDTTEERRAAHNASSRRSYANLELLDNLQGTQPVEVEANIGYPHTQHYTSLTEAMNQVDRLSARVTILTLGSPQRYTDILYQEYQRSVTLDRPQGFRSLLDDAVLEVSSLEQCLREQERVVLNSRGTESEMERVRVVLDPVRVLAGWLEEILCEAMISPANLREKYIHGDLAFLRYDWRSEAYFLRSL